MIVYSRELEVASEAIPDEVRRASRILRSPIWDSQRSPSWRFNKGKSDRISTSMRPGEPGSASETRRILATSTVRYATKCRNAALTQPTALPPGVYCRWAKPSK